MATDADFDGYAEYTSVELDLSAYADGTEHDITFAASFTGEGATNFFVDDAELVACEPNAGGDESSAGDASTGSDSGSGVPPRPSTTVSFDVLGGCGVRAARRSNRAPSQVRDGSPLRRYLEHCRDA